MKDELRRIVAAELAAPVQPEVREFASWLARRAKKPPLAILFYGSALRTGALDGILDFYVVADALGDWSQGRLAALANRLLPPNVEYHEAVVGNSSLRAKVAILSLRQFRRLARPESLDNSVWARFSQPAAVVYARDPRAAEAITDAISSAVATAVVWAARLGPAEPAPPADFWRALFRGTYASELRVETSGRSDNIVNHAPDRFERLFLLGCAAEGIPIERLADNRVLSSSAASRRSLTAWRRRRRLAKPLNVARLAKAAFTFRGGADYVVWKIRRHTGQEIVLTDRQRRWPLLLAIPLIRRLWRRRRRASG